MKVKAYDKALVHFERAEDHGMKCGNKANVTLLREAEQCIKIFLEKKENQANAPNESTEYQAGSDDDDHDDEDKIDQ